jgi:hypothetical protein
MSGLLFDLIQNLLVVKLSSFSSLLDATLLLSLQCDKTLVSGFTKY